MAKFKIPPHLGNVKQLIKRFETAKERKDPWISHLRECYEYALPQRDTFNTYQKGAKKNVHIFDSTAVTGLGEYASRLQSTLIPPWRQFSILVPGSEVPEDNREEIQKGLDKVNEVLFDNFNHSNFSTQAHEAFLDLGVSTGCITLEEATSGPSLFHFNAVPLAEIFPEEGPNGTIETQWRHHTDVLIRNVERMFPDVELSTNTKKKLASNKEARINLIEGNVFDPKNDSYYHCVIEEKEKHLAFVQTFEEASAWITFREMVVPGEVLGRGRIMSILPDIKTANKMVELVLRNASLAVSGVYTATSDPVINPYTMQLAPGTMIPVDSNDSSNPTLRPLDRAGDFNVSQLVLEDLQNRIRKTLFAEPLGSIEEIKGSSATEMTLRNQELVMNSGAAFSRLQTEFIEKIIKRAVHILKKNGKIPDLKVDGKEVTIKHTSPLARAQDQEDLMAMQQWIEMGSSVGPEAFALSAKVEDIPGWIGKKLGVEQDLMRTEGEKKEIQQTAAQAQANAAQPQQPQ